MFESYYIVDLDLRSSGIQIGKRSFMNLEVTLFLKKPIEFKSNELKKEIKNIIFSIYNDNILNTIFFNIHKTKMTKELV
jgi:23S rRNA maturation-related 3'-5' exoribonuclease YhaM